MYDSYGIRAACMDILAPQPVQFSVPDIWFDRGALQNFGFFHPDEIEGYEDEGRRLIDFQALSKNHLLMSTVLTVWNIPASQEKLMKACDQLHPDLQAVCS